ncbi:dephospho-CoA kinase [Arthrobacter sp. HY1533]|uniref:dephospho-CoA kinase n=1 Tax=Arthrobacter sp. HY1533 TaxID=2970919 RepID=UPI0022B9D759|nr:dephospho-CoA kinase [Arthrobacter sp. HY1533]
MLSLGLTGGIAAGKSLLTNRFRELGAVVVDADLLAREAVAPGSPGLAAVADRFGAGILLPDGSLDRPKLGAIVFSDPAARESLNAIVHPLVRSAAAALKDGARPGDVVVQDIPLLVETGQGADFHLVVVVQAPLEERVARMVRDRGMSRDDALARMAAQASDEDRAAAADVVIVNDGTPEQAVAALDELWHVRLLPFAANLAAGVPARGTALAVTVAESGTGAAARLLARIDRALGETGSVVQIHDGGHPTDAFPAQSLAFQVVLAPDAVPGVLAELLAAVGFFPKLPVAGGVTRFESADPGLPAVLDIAALTGH